MTPVRQGAAAGDSTPVLRAFSLLLGALLASPSGGAALGAAPARPAAGTTSATEASPAGTSASVVSIGDIRGGDSSSHLEIELELPEFRAAEVAATRVHVKRALDDTGRDLVPEKERKTRLEPLQQGPPPGPGEKPAPVVVQLELRNPSRRAVHLAEVSGQIELYLPGRDPNAVARIPNIAARAGKQLESPTLAASRVRIALLTEEQLEAEKKRQAEKRKEDARKRGVLGEMLESIAAAFIQAFFTPGAGDVVLSVEDPDGRIVQMTLLDASGEDQTTGRSQQQDLTVLSSSPRGPGPDWSLEVRLRTPKSQESRSFTLRNVPLP